MPPTARSTSTTPACGLESVDRGETSVVASSVPFLKVFSVVFVATDRLAGAPIGGLGRLVPGGLSA